MTTATIETNEVTKMTHLHHPFELSGLGKAPFRYLGFSENVIKYDDGTSQAGGTCDHCCAGIRYQCHIQSADGKKSVVGCDCILKLNHCNNRAVDPAMVAKVTSEVAKRRREQARQRRAAKRAATARENEAAFIKLDMDALANHPHPSIAGKTFADYVTWCYKNIGVEAFAFVLKRAAGLTA
jgi:hypothetical protein